MIDPTYKQYGVRDPTLKLDSLALPRIPVLPEAHPCRGCKLLEWDTGVPYCFLPRCDRDIFKLDGRDEIIARFPLSYGKFIEVFGGAGWVLFRKQPEKFEVYNDFNANLVNLFRVVKTNPEALIEELDWTLNSRMEFEELKALFAGKAEMGDVERAAKFFRLIKLSYGSKCESFGGNPVVLERRFPAIRAVHRRLARGVIIENKDFEALIRQYDRTDAFFYLNPPYFGTEDYYHDVGFTVSDHKRLFKVLKKIKGKFLLSYNDDPFIRKLYRNYQIESTSRLSSLAQCYEGGAQYPEVFIANYDMAERSRQNEQLSIIL